MYLMHALKHKFNLSHNAPEDPMKISEQYMNFGRIIEELTTVSVLMKLGNTAGKSFIDIEKSNVEIIPPCGVPDETLTRSEDSLLQRVHFITHFMLNVQPDRQCSENHKFHPNSYLLQVVVNKNNQHFQNLDNI
ncbi:CLUMA_CG010091, isoform A [Clunio marinus]|uniref:CLUMA_CG010091, isoform A n=1 Tax=Clunio marinus TaxID=568069 RepID=A0A1J1IC77_9DIPT|nr:CLUMA_CG010091, isoform A [Clunio marinus]